MELVCGVCGDAVSVRCVGGGVSVRCVGGGADHTLEGSSPLWPRLEPTHHPVRNITHPIIYMHVVNVSYTYTI